MDTILFRLNSFQINMKSIYFKKIKALFTFVMLITVNTTAFAACNLDLQNGYGPYDYYDPKSSSPTGADPMGKIKRVTNVHLSQKMLLLTGRATGPISADLDYTLRAIPNHPEALNLASRLELRLRSRTNSALLRDEKMKRSADCYFQRAFKFASSSETYAIYGVHLHRSKQYEEAKSAYQKSIEMGLKSANIHYNLGLTLVRLKEYALSEKHAHIAYQLGYPLKGLEKQLKTAGYCSNGC